MSDAPIKQTGKRGRPKGKRNAHTIELEKKAQEFAGDALKALQHIALKGKSESARVSAATALLDRGYGRPKQAIEHSGEDGGPLEVVVTYEVVTPVAEDQD